MKRVLFLIVNLIFLSLQIRAQDDSNSSYDQSCYLWRIENNSSPGNNNSVNNIFNWEFTTAPVTSQILDVFFIDSLYGWTGHTGNGGLRTTNSGFNWETFSFNDTNFTTSYNGVYFLNRDTGWCVGGAVQIRKTTNGGINWFKQYGPPVAGIARSVKFFNANTGIIVGSKNFPYAPFIAKTTNGGTNWLEITPFTTGQELNDQFWLNENTGWIAGYDALLYTTNGGTSFINLYSNIPPSGNGHIALLAIQFVNSQTGWLGAANLERNNIYKTTNGGANWFFQNNPVSQAGWNQINDVRFISADTGWAVHGTPGTGAIMFTSNGGTNWSMDNIQYSWYDCLEAHKRSKVWCGGSSGRIWYTILSGPVGINFEYNSNPASFVLYQNYPNPFNPNTVIRYSLASRSGLIENRLTIIKVYDILGNEIAFLVNEKQNVGSYSVEFDGSNYPSGIYYYKLWVSTPSGEARDLSEVRKMILVK